MSYSNYQLNQRINNLQQQISGGGSATLQTVLDNGNSALNTNIILNAGVPTTSQTTISQGFLNLIGPSEETIYTGNTIKFSNSTGDSTLVKSTNNLNITSDNINLYGQASFDTPPHSITPILGNDLATKGYVDSLVGQYSGGFNLYLN